MLSLGRSGVFVVLIKFGFNNINKLYEWATGVLSNEPSRAKKGGSSKSEADDTMTPSNRCNHVTPHDEVTSELGGLSCWRKTWGQTNKCIWHAEESNKPIDELADARLDRAERIDNVYLTKVDLGDKIDFENCVLRKANFKAKLSDANFAGSYLKRANFNDSHIDGADFSNCDGERAKFRNVKGRDVNFSDASLVHANFESDRPVANTFTYADFQGADLFDSSFENTYLQQADFSGSRLTHVSFVDAEPEQADFDGADVRDADFAHSKLDGAYFADARISTTTDFGKIVAYERIADERAENSAPRDKFKLDFLRLVYKLAYSPNLWFRKKFNMQSDKYRHRVPLRILGLYSYLLNWLPTQPHIGRDRALAKSVSDLVPDDDGGLITSGGGKLRQILRSMWRFYNRLSPEISFRSSDKHDLEAAERTYRNYQTILSGTPQKNKQIDFRVREKAVRRKLAWSQSNRWEWLKLSLSRWVTKHGESPWHVGFVSATIIGVCTAFYPIFGLTKTNSNGEIIRFSYDGSLDLITTLGDSFYFSVVSFLTLGYGNIDPIGYAEYLAIAEKFSGAIMMALLVFVLGRKTVQ